MKKKKLFVTLTAILAVCLVTLVGCSNNEKKASEKKTETTMEQIKKRGKLIVATEAAFPPYEFMENGKIVGYGPDILNEIVKSLGVQVEQLDVPFSGILAGLTAKKYDFVATAVSISPERKEKYGLTIPIGDNSIVLIKLKDNKEINKISDLKGKILGLLTAAIGEKKIKEYDEKAKAEGKEGLGLKEIKYYQVNSDKYLDLKNGRIDVAMQNVHSTKEVMAKEPNTYEIVATFGDPIYSSWAVRKEDKDLLDFLNAEILKLKKSGKLAELQTKWFGSPLDLPDQLP